MPRVALVLLAFLAASSGVFLPASFPPSIEDILKVCQPDGKNGSMIPPFQLRPLWCLLFQPVAPVAHTTAAPTSRRPPYPTIQPPASEIPHICVTNEFHVFCTQDYPTDCPRSFDLDLMRVKEAWKCDLKPKQFLSEIKKSRSNKDNSSLAQLYRLTYANRNVLDTKECHGPFLCEYSSIARKHICPKEVGGTTSICIPVPQM